MLSSSARHDLRSVCRLGGYQSDRPLWLTAIRTARRKQALFIGFGSTEPASAAPCRPWLLYYVNGGPAARVLLSCLCVANSCLFFDEVQDRNIDVRRSSSVCASVNIMRSIGSRDRNCGDSIRLTSSCRLVVPFCKQSPVHVYRGRI